MQNFKYEFRDNAGNISSAVIQAETLSQATHLVKSQGLCVLDVVPLRDGLGGVLQRMQSVNVGGNPGLKDLMNFTGQLAVMIKAGISIREGLEGIARQCEKPKFRRILQLIKADVEAGQPLSVALDRHPKVFSTLYVNMIRASELSGDLGTMLERINDYLRQQHETRSMVIGAMVYPAIIGIMAIGTTVFMLTWVLPKFTTLFAGKEAILPKPTVILMAISDFLRTYWWGVILGVAGLGAGFWAFTHNPRGKELWDAAKLKLPLFRKMLRALYVSRGMQTMGELVNAGVPMLETLEITADVSGNTVFKRMWADVHTAVEQGEKISRPLERQNMLPGNVVQMISAGEESGKLGAVMRDVADYYAMELRNAIKALTAMIEPLMIVVMGFIVGFIAMSIMLPIFKMSSLAKQ